MTNQNKYLKCKLSDAIKGSCIIVCTSPLERRGFESILKNNNLRYMITVKKHYSYFWGISSGSGKLHYPRSVKFKRLINDLV